jgi:superfamily II DNA or RNA helicase
MQFYKVVSSLACRYKFGLTATPKRSDGLTKSMLALLGEIIIEIPKAAVADTTCPVKVQAIHTKYMPDCDAITNDDGTINYSFLIDDLIHNKERFEFVKTLVNSHTSCLVLANRVEYLERLTEAYISSGRKGVCLSVLGNSKKAKEIRKDALVKLNNGEIDCIFATYQLAAEGLDVPSLNNLILATPEKDERIVMQAVGRVGRKADGKEFGMVYDLVDGFGMFSGWAVKRKGYYKKLGYTYIDIN